MKKEIIFTMIFILLFCFCTSALVSIIIFKPKEESKPHPEREDTRIACEFPKFVKEIHDIACTDYEYDQGVDGRKYGEDCGDWLCGGWVNVRNAEVNEIGELIIYRTNTQGGWNDGNDTTQIFHVQYKDKYIGEYELNIRAEDYNDPASFDEIEISYNELDDKIELIYTCEKCEIKVQTFVFDKASGQMTDLVKN